MASKTIYLLIGPKGSGKSFIGTLMQEQFHIPFMRVEDWVKAIKKDRSIDNDSYLQEAFQTIESGIRETLEQQDTLVFESTGLTPYFDAMFQNLQTDFHLITIKVIADETLCLQRVKSRDQSIHINISDNQVLQINQQVQQKNLSCDYQIHNTQNTTKEQLLMQLHTILIQA